MIMPNYPVDEQGLYRISKRQPCVRCHTVTDTQLVRCVTANGVSQVYWICLTCKQAVTNPRQSIQHKKLKDAGVIIDKIPVETSYIGGNVCAVCGRPNVENHHWAPRHLFGDDADVWPQAYLCPDCHRTWHNLVTPEMSKAHR